MKKQNEETRRAAVTKSLLDSYAIPLTRRTRLWVDSISRSLRYTLKHGMVYGEGTRDINAKR